MAEAGAVLIINFAVVTGAMIALWLISIRLGDVSFIDSFWALGLVLVAFVTFTLTANGSGRRLLILALTAAWGLRLGVHLLLRWRREGPDGRYLALLRRAPGNVHRFTLWNVFLLQGVMLWLVSLPVQLGQVSSQAESLGLLAFAGVALYLIGMLFEVIGDRQLAVFRADPANRGRVMDLGLWRYTRHPNYFGDACVWWGLYLIAAETSWGRWSFFGPALLTWTLLRWSGAALLERRLSRSKEGYEAYRARTSSFIPWPPRKQD